MPPAGCCGSRRSTTNPRWGSIRAAEHSDAFARFSNVENRIERIEAEADLVNYRGKPSLEEEFNKLEGDEDIEKELASLKKEMAEKSPEKNKK